LFDPAKTLTVLKNSHRLRSVHEYILSGNKITVSGAELINFSSNDYLSLSVHDAVINTSIGFTKKYGAGSASSRLICGNIPPYAEAEKKLSELNSTQSSLIFSSGYAANTGIIGSLSNSGTGFFVDRLCHASIADALAVSRRNVHRFKHNDTGHLETLLKKYSSGYENSIIITETVFSMDGDTAPVRDIAGLAKKYSAMLYLDEAHAIGVFGTRGGGLHEEAAVLPAEDLIIMGTCGKALGSFGAFFSGTPAMREYLINTSRPFIYTTALPPSVLGALVGALNVLQAEPDIGKVLLARARLLRTELQSESIPLIDGNSQIICIKAGTDENALSLSAWLKSHRVFAPAIRPPTVPEGQSRIRVTLTRGHTESDINELINALKGFRDKGGLADSVQHSAVRDQRV